MIALQAAVLGIVQGLTEFLPVSSSAHLVVVPWLFGWADPVIASLSFDVALHMGTLLAVVVFFRKDWVRVIGAWFRSIAERRIGQDPDRRMGWFLLASVVPGGLAGILFESKVTSSFHELPISQSSMIAMAAVIAALGVILWLADTLAARAKELGKLTLKDALIVGFAQALAIFPGVSRSGATISAGRALGYDRPSAARFSFLLSAPIIAGSGIKSLYDLLKAGGFSGEEGIAFPIGFATAAVSGLLCIKFLMGFIQKRSFKGFAIYRFALAALVLAVALAR